MSEKIKLLTALFSEKEDSVEDFKCSSTKNYNYVIVRTYSAGVHAGFLSYHNKSEVILKKARRLFYWTNVKGISLSDLAVRGLGEDSKVCDTLKEIYLSNAIEIIPCTDEAMESIKNYTVYKK